MPIEESTIMLSFIGILIGALLKEIINLNQRLYELEHKIDNIEDTNELNRIKDNLIELKGMVHMLTCYHKIFRPPGGQT